MALAVAYLLVLQALLGGVATGAHAAAGLSPGAGPTICLGMDRGDTPSGPADPAHHTPDCCTIGCQNAGLTALPPPAATTPLAPVAFTDMATLVPPTAGSLPGIERLSHPPRAPPAD
ncbi:hypothetical protein MKI84_03625 [Ancylobacter sp. A5.8]|uniref:hypothetical protein n=1 Tax=Ancylobacter gelatini TaxID=2919920 RepID=UPI001F4DD6DA|nr:hypothetical protein [Ancylobacter gelatini]MCJ8141998.1 hypothetical protein [Ancylobacter gelatini]